MIIHNVGESNSNISNIEYPLHGDYFLSFRLPKPSLAYKGFTNDLYLINKTTGKENRLSGVTLQDDCYHGDIPKFYDSKIVDRTHFEICVLDGQELYTEQILEILKDRRMVQTD